MERPKMNGSDELREVPLTGNLDFNSSLPSERPPSRGKNPEYDQLSDELDELEAWHTESERLQYIHPDGTQDKF